MDITCNIIKDLLPLYAEDMVSDDSKKMVDDHLCGCDDCTKELAVIKKASKMPLEVDIKSLKRVGDTIRRRRILTVATAVMLVITILVSGFSWLMVDIWLEADEAVISVEAMEDGTMMFWLEDYVMGHSGMNWGERNSYHAHCWYTNRYEKLRVWWEDMQGVERKPNHYLDDNIKYWEGDLDDYPSAFDIPEDELIAVPVNDDNHYYFNVYDCTYDVLLWDAGMPFLEMRLNYRCDILSQNFWCAVALTILFGICGLFIKKPWIKELSTRFSIVAGSVVFSTLFLTGGKFVVSYVSDEPYGTLKWIYTMSVFVTLTVLLFRQLRKLNKKEKAI